MYTSTAAKLATGIDRSMNPNSPTNTSSHTPCRIAEARVVPPACTLAALRTITPVIGSAPNKPHTVLPDSLGHQLAVVISPLPIVHLIDGRRAQQRLGAGN